MAQTQAPTLPGTLYVTLTGVVDQGMTHRVFQSMAIALNGGVKEIHALLQSTGGNVSDGVGLYNYLKAIPINFHFYNGGTVSSIAVIAFLGASNRYASANATFMIHKTHSPHQMPATNANRLRALANSYDIDDARTGSILRTHLTFSEEQWNDHLLTELPIDATEALTCGLITEIRDFVVPQGSQISNI
jgi:ATP-dependent Clp protease protease subunit